jgi:hypothetical protein
MWCEICGYQKHEGCCEECIGHTTDGQCVTAELLEEWETAGVQAACSHGGASSPHLVQ